MMRRLLDRNIATLVVVVLAGQLLAAALLYELVMRPQTRRLAEVTAEMTDTIGRNMASMTPAERRALVGRFNAEDALLIRPGDQPPSIGLRNPTLIESEFLSAISHRLNHDRMVEWRADTQSWLWVHLWLGGDDWWVSLTPRGLRAPMLSTFIALGSALCVSIAGGIALQRFFDQPLRRLVRAVDSYDPQRGGPPISEAGPEEIAAVAHAFNRMTARIDEQEAERALMLGSVSHDLRTPLARLRLSLALMHSAEADLLESAGRQVDQIEAMLSQFLDFARGFDSEMPERIDLAARLHRIADDSGLGSDLALSVAPGLTVVARPMAFDRAIANLLANARSYGAAPFRLEARAAAGHVHVAVGDGGAGFDPADAPALCRPFARANAARTGTATGLGLAIVQRIVAAHDGTLDFAHRDGLFWATVTLPTDR